MACVGMPANIEKIYMTETDFQKAVGLLVGTFNT